MIFSKIYYDDMKDYFHPNVRVHIERISDPNDDLIYLSPYHSCDWKTRGGREKAILYRNGNLCVLGGQYHPGKLRISKFPPHVQYTRYMSFVDDKVKFLYKNRGDYIYNFRTGKYDHLSVTPIKDRYFRFIKSKKIYLDRW